MPRDVAFLENVSIGLARVRAEFTVDGKWVTELMIQLEVFHLGEWMAARRYDDAHGQPHLDILNPEGRIVEKTWLECSRNEAVTMALEDFDQNWEKYVDEFREW